MGGAYRGIVLASIHTAISYDRKSAAKGRHESPRRNGRELQTLPAP